MRIPLSSHAADLMRMVSCIRALWTRDLFASVIAERQLMLPLRQRRTQTVLAQQSNHVAIRTPYDILDGRRSQFRKYFRLLNIKQHHRGRGG